MKTTRDIPDPLSTGHGFTLRTSIAAVDLRGGRVQDARIAAICLDHDVQELWSADRDFNHVPSLLVRNPLVA